jgi:hypothetical protein
MRIVLLSIAFLFLAFSAQSQVLKSAGVWYFLDVDSMTARPAVLPNGTEIAYVVGTKTVYYWNRNTSAWTAYGSTFNRDSIYFDSSIVGSGTVGDPWRVDSTLFATIAAVGDSIAAALLDYVEISDTAAMLSNYIERGDTNLMLTNYVTFGNLSSYPTGTGTADRLARWTATNTLAAGNLSDNGTRLAALLPWQFQTYTTAGLPTGVTGYTVYETTKNGIAWYQGSRWAYGLESTFNRGTATRVPYFDANGQITDNSLFIADPSNNRYYMSGTGNTGTNTLTSSTGLRWELRTNDNGDNTGGFLALGSQFGIGAAIKYIHVIGSGNTAGGISFYTRESGANATLTRQLTIDYTGNVQVAKDMTLLGNFTAGRFRVNTASVSGGTYGNLTEGILAAGTYQNTQTAMKLDFALGNYDFQTAPVGTVGTAVTLTSRMFLTNTGLLRLGGIGTTNYQLDIQGTNAIGLPRGTVGNQPSIVASTTPMRFFTDTAAIGYGDGGVYNFLATRAYARSLVSALPTTNIYIANGSLTANRTLHGAGYTLRFNANTIVRDSLKIANLADHTDPDSIVTTKGGYLGKKKFLMPSANAHDGASTGFFSDDFTLGFQTSGNGFYHLDYADTLGYWEKTTYGNGSNPAWSSIFGDASEYFTSITTRGVATNSTAFIRVDSNRVRMYHNSFAEVKFDIDLFSGVLSLNYGTGTKEAADLSKTQSNYIAGFATDGTILDLETKRDTTIYVVDADYDFSAALTTSQVSRRYNRIIFLMTTTAGAGSDSELTLHTPDANLMQVEYLIRSTDEAGGFTNVIRFGTNNAVDSTNGLVSSYFPAAGQGVGIRAGLRSGSYKYWYY